MPMTSEILGKTRCRLGESPLWDPDAQVLFWVDSVAPAIWRYDPASGEQSQFPAPDLIGSIVLGGPGTLVAGVRDKFYRVDVASGSFSLIAAIDGLAPNERLNDGKTDRSGRYVTGTMIMGDGAPAGRLLSLEPNQSPRILPTDAVAISNSICFSPSGDTLYYADSLRGLVWAYDYDQTTGHLGAHRDLIDTSPTGSGPDGATVDAEGYIWIALVQSQKLGRYAPDGRLDRLLDAPAPFPSCPAFGGPGLDILYVTSIADSGGRLVSPADEAGRLFAYHGLGVRGIAETRCRL